MEDIKPCISAAKVTECEKQPTGQVPPAAAETVASAPAPRPISQRRELKSIQQDRVEHWLKKAVKVEVDDQSMDVQASEEIGKECAEKEKAAAPSTPRSYSKAVPASSHHPHRVSPPSNSTPPCRVSHVPSVSSSAHIGSAKATAPSPSAGPLPSSSTIIPAASRDVKPHIGVLVTSVSPSARIDPAKAAVLSTSHTHSSSLDVNPTPTSHVIHDSPSARVDTIDPAKMSTISTTASSSIVSLAVSDSSSINIVAPAQSRIDLQMPVVSNPTNPLPPSPNRQLRCPDTDDSNDDVVCLSPALPVSPSPPAHIDNAILKRCETSLACAMKKPCSYYSVICQVISVIETVKGSVVLRVWDGFALFDSDSGRPSINRNVYYVEPPHVGTLLAEPTDGRELVPQQFYLDVVVFGEWAELAKKRLKSGDLVQISNLHHSIPKAVYHHLFLVGEGAVKAKVHRQGVYLVGEAQRRSHPRLISLAGITALRLKQLLGQQQNEGRSPKKTRSDVITSAPTPINKESNSMAKATEVPVLLLPPSVDATPTGERREVRQSAGGSGTGTSSVAAATLETEAAVQPVTVKNSRAGTDENAVAAEAPSGAGGTGTNTTTTTTTIVVAAGDVGSADESESTTTSSESESAGDSMEEEEQQQQTAEETARECVETGESARDGGEEEQERVLEDMETQTVSGDGCPEAIPHEKMTSLPTATATASSVVVVPSPSAPSPSDVIFDPSASEYRLIIRFPVPKPVETPDVVPPPRVELTLALKAMLREAKMRKMMLDNPEAAERVRERELHRVGSDLADTKRARSALLSYQSLLLHGPQPETVTLEQTRKLKESREVDGRRRSSLRSSTSSAGRPPRRVRFSLDQQGEQEQPTRVSPPSASPSDKKPRVRAKKRSVWGIESSSSSGEEYVETSSKRRRVNERREQ